MESLSSYARQFLGQMEKPDVESIEGLPPAISIDQKSTNRNPRSTVGTVTEIYDYFRLLYARIGIPHCPKCGRAMRGPSWEYKGDACSIKDKPPIDSSFYDRAEETAMPPAAPAYIRRNGTGIVFLSAIAFPPGK